MKLRLLWVGLLVSLTSSCALAQLGRVYNVGPIIEFSYPSTYAAKWIRSSKLKRVDILQLRKNGSFDTLPWIRIEKSGDTLIVWDTESILTNISKFDGKDSLISRWESSSNGYRESTIFDSLGREILKVEGIGKGNTDRWRYFDSLGLPRMEVNGYLNTYYYGSSGRIDSIQESSGVTRIYSYNRYNQVLTIVSMDRGRRSWVDSFSYLHGKKSHKINLSINTSLKNHTGKVDTSIFSEYWYDNQGNVIKERKYNHEHKSIFRYDRKNRMIEWPGYKSQARARWGGKWRTAW